MMETAWLILLHVGIFAGVGGVLLLVRLTGVVVRLGVSILSKERYAVSSGNARRPDVGHCAIRLKQSSGVVGERSVLHASARPLPDSFPISLFMSSPCDELWNSSNPK